MALTLANTLTTEEWGKLLETEMEKCVLKQMNPLVYVPPSGDYAAGVNDTSAVNMPSHAHTFTAGVGTQATVPPQWGEQHLQSMLASRMNWGYGTKCPFQRVLPWKVTIDKVVVFVALETEAILIEDDANLYPSDALITQLRLLAEAT
jgi:hypothetical protein